MSRILGDPKTIERVRNAKAGDPSVYVNYDAISLLPDEYESKIDYVDYDINQDFTNVGTKDKPSFYPETSLMYKISEKRGVSAFAEAKIETIIEDVNLSEMEMTDEPKIIKKKVGYMVTKKASILQEDGTLRPVERVGIFNAWDECSKLWADEEKKTEGYIKPLGTWDDGNKKEKYDTKWKRRAHFQELLDKSFGMADTTSKLKCIRELAGLKTGYTKEDLKEGKFYFAKIIRSAMAIKMETAAKLAAITHGQKAEPLAIESAEGTQTHELEPDFMQAAEPITKEDDINAVIAGLPPAEKLKMVLAYYTEEKLVPQNLVLKTGKLLDWLEIELRRPNNDILKNKYWQNAVDTLNEIEKGMKDIIKLAHGLGGGK